MSLIPPKKTKPILVKLNLVLLILFILAFITLSLNRLHIITLDQTQLTIYSVFLVACFTKFVFFGFGDE